MAILPRSLTRRVDPADTPLFALLGPEINLWGTDFIPLGWEKISGIDFAFPGTDRAIFIVWGYI